MVAVGMDRGSNTGPVVVIGLTDLAYAAALSHQLRARGWRAVIAETASAVHTLAERMRAAIVVLSVDRPEESGFLTCAKLREGKRKPRVVLVAEKVSEGRDAFAAYVGAADFVPESIGPRALAAKVEAMSLVRV